MTLKGGLNFMQSKTRWWILGTGGTAVVVVLSMAGYLLLAPGPAYVPKNSPATQPQALSADDVAHAYAQGFETLDAAAAAKVTDDPTAAAAALNLVFKNMSNARLTAGLAGNATGDTASMSVDWHSGQLDMAYQVPLKMVQANGKWVVHWSDANIHPDLAKGQSLALRTTPGGSSLTDRNGQPLTLDSVPKSVKAGVQQAIGGDLQAVDGHSITIVDATGADVKTLEQKEGTKKAAYVLTIDGNVQVRAGNAYSQVGSSALLSLAPVNGLDVPISATRSGS